LVGADTFGQLAGDAGAPDEVVRTDGAAALHRDGLAVVVRDGFVEQDVDAELVQMAHALLCGFFGHGGQDPAGGFDEEDLHHVGVEFGIVLGEDVSLELRDTAGHFDTGRAATYHDKGHQATPLVGGCGLNGCLQVGQHAVTDVQGVLNGF